MKRNFEIVAFDLDDTLALSKAPLDEEMSKLLCDLLARKKVAVVSGASFNQFQKQFLSHLNCAQNNLKNLHILPTNGASLYKYAGAWQEVYSHNLSESEKQNIFQAFEKTFQETGYQKPEKIYGELIEDRGSQITFSGLGSEAPLELKAVWDPKHERRARMIEVLKKYLPELSVSIGGSTSIDITKRGIDKAYGMDQLLKYLDLPPASMLYVGDALFPGGNDASVLKLSTQVASVDEPGLEDTKKLISDLIVDIDNEN